MDESKLIYQWEKVNLSKYAFINESKLIYQNIIHWLETTTKNMITSSIDDHMFKLYDENVD